MSVKPHILIIGKVWPEPGSSAAGSRTLQLIDIFLSAGWEVSFASAAGDSLYRCDLESLGVCEYTIALNSSSFDVFVKDLQPAIVMFDRFTMEEQFGWRVAEQCPGALRILDTIDLHCLRQGRHTALKEKREFDLTGLVNDTAKRELASIYRCDLSLMISTAEMELLENYFNVDKALLHYVPLMPDPITREEQLNWPVYGSRRHFVTIGNFLHEPNWDSVLYLKQELWPLIRKQLPDAEMHVYGAYPSQKVFQLHNDKEGFLIKGRAEDVKAVMQQARICLAPLRFGAGIKGKLLDAMLCGTPSITTAIGAEGMHGELPWNGTVERTTGALAAAAVNLYRNEMQWQQAQQNGVAIVNTFFSKTKHAEKLLDTISLISINLDNHRLKNFTGAMLMHQSLSATRYMSLWIEAKNKVKAQQ